jgi:peptide/nickel transport system permease protein
MLKKAIRLLIIILCVTCVTFLMVDQMPGDVAYLLAGQEASLEDVRAIRQELGLDQPIVIRYFRWLSQVAGGNLGRSYLTQEPVLDAIVTRLPVTLELILLAQLLALGWAIPAGIFCAYRPRSIGDKTIGSVAFATMSVPVFVMALFLIMVFALKLRWFPATGYIPLSEGLWANFRSLVLPAVSIAMVEWVTLMRVLRSDMITTLQEDYILMARSKGLPACHILFRHAFRPSLFTLITILGMQIGHLIGGALIIEVIFALPGIGRLLIGAIYGQDIMMVQGCVLLIAVAYVIINALVDLCYFLLDPRIRREGSVG